MGALDYFWTFKIFVLEGLLCVLLNSFAFDQIPLSTLLVFIFQQFSVSIQIQCKFEWHRWLHAVKYIARKSWKAGVGLVAQVGWFQTDMQRFFIEGTNCCTLCDCMSWDASISYIAQKGWFSVWHAEILLKEQIVVLWVIIWLGNVLHILFYICAIILRENFV